MAGGKDLYEIMYDWIDMDGCVRRGMVETFTGTPSELQARIQTMRQQGCYNISITKAREIA